MLKRFAAYFRPHRRLFFLDLACAFLVGLADEFMPLIVRNMINQYVPDRNWNMMVRWSFALLGIYLLKLLLNLIINYWGHIMGVRLQADMRRDLFQHIESLPVSFFDENKTGSIMSRITNDLQEISEMAHHGPENIFTSAVMLTVSAVMLGRINLKLTIIVYAFLPVAVLFVILIRKGQMAAFRQNRVEIGEINGETETSIAGIRVTKAYGGTEGEMEKFDRTNLRYVEARKRSYKYLALFNSGMTFFTDMMYVVVVIFGGRMFFAGSINSGDFVAYLLYISMFLTPIKKLVETYEQIADGISGYERFEEIMNIPSEKDDSGAVEVGRLKGDISFEDVSFHYQTQEASGRKVISHMNLHIPAGHTVGLAGPSGGGKTTICNLIPRFYEIDSGTIRIDGIDIRHMTRASLRRNIGIVAQDVFLFNGTIRENIAYGNPDATDEEIIEAAKKAEIHEDIMAMPDGYDTNVGERGVHLSGGQRQRISIARVFLKNPQILILDEATSALDNATEMQIQKSLDELAKGRTVLVVAHRLSTIRKADEIIMVSSEGIKERGTSEELLAKHGLYWQLYEYQFADLS
ncbi:MAG: ABC transporter ATP-binding protein [Stecheria intestinalis]|jgi:ATP-binding cassette subfamily B protein|uniref:ABC transporter ATP-binding protein n=1 Tax=Stecheria intestinalis TaxID=2606630 RepID=UPI0023F2F310|nr:ABC transporter ATP-binding protein [Stecheria intestinalis]MDD5882028.1 ABC transporter ATP-binding protein [Stecheria intestinalis]MDD6367227.1 ABC transporter ATP-binding protein [Stecheria intestinalis]